MTTNEFMNNLYNAIGCEVSGVKDGLAFLGKITATRAKYGNDIRVTVEDEFNIYLIDGAELMDGKGGGYTNLHVYF